VRGEEGGGKGGGVRLSTTDKRDYLGEKTDSWGITLSNSQQHGAQEEARNLFPDKATGGGADRYTGKGFTEEKRGSSYV